MAKDFGDRTPLNIGNEPRALAEARAKHRMRDVGDRFVERRDRESLRHAALTEPGDLREDEPHPVTALPTGSQLAEHRFIRRSSSLNKALQSKAIFRCQRHNVLTRPSRPSVRAGPARRGCRAARWRA